MFTITADPVIGLGDFKALLGLTEDQPAILALNAVSQKARRFMGRSRLLYVADTDIVELLRETDAARLPLHAPIFRGTGEAVEAKLYISSELQDTLTLAENEFACVSDDYHSYLDAGALRTWRFTGEDSGTIVVTYKGGWGEVPAEVVQGALLQARVDLNRMKGLVGMSSLSAGGETTSYETAGIVREVAEMWLPYKVYD